MKMERIIDNVRYEHERVNTVGGRALGERGTKRGENRESTKTKQTMKIP